MHDSLLGVRTGIGLWSHSSFASTTLIYKKAISVCICVRYNLSYVQSVTNWLILVTMYNLTI